MTKNSKKHFPLAYDINGLSEASGRGRSKIYEDIAAGLLITRRAGGKNIILYDDAMAWLQALPVREPAASSAAKAR